MDEACSTAVTVLSCRRALISPRNSCQVAVSETLRKVEAYVGREVRRWACQRTQTVSAGARDAESSRTNDRLALSTRASTAGLAEASNAPERALAPTARFAVAGSPKRHEHHALGRLHRKMRSRRGASQTVGWHCSSRKRYAGA